ncbi:MAG TPA: RNA pseudouridine synthase [Bacteroidales bacterium]|jgi:23S rRNA pseudouridine1911/1915/1917 synthase|nr:RNA pseudouridine synthase [Bacteroidota bacterium]HJN05641.1 RNA pseudouridine synthase [Bacteroidales bacterium]|tara:strand:- start:44 stop:751 length:708 start_codon:yes stop_codon:yes gene_type:complete
MTTITTNKYPLSTRVLYEDNHLIVVNKLPSEIVQGDKTGDTPLSEIVKAYLKEKYQKPGNVFTGVIHRIDRPASGVVVFARTGKALTRMNELVKNRDLKKIYWAIVQNKPEKLNAELKHYLVRNSKKNKSFAYSKSVTGSKEGVLRYKLIGESDSYYLLEIDLKTGRHHQIRAQLAAIGNPIKGDLKYGSPRSNKDASISLHAHSLEFMHPVKKEILKIVASPPKDPLWDYFSNL